MLCKELYTGQSVLIVNCEMGYELYWIKRQVPGALIWGLTMEKIGAEVAGKTFSVCVCDNLQEGMAKYYQQQSFDRIALLGDCCKLSQSDRLVQMLRHRLTVDGLLFFGNQNGIYRMPKED